ncbi:PLP-dependent aminotransferase family protein [Paenibacillus agilis]|uniref:PLP-dependent aminotransferase family protein n=1 Tax=Paenibacillus agilis TaxID=3020863 RepID=A0A559IKC8_9BACL|nr:PLP-dependent aminotransferase family protein [Paenibacillus agilis]TVX88115.1 PLP-dependent aminotransferase family protein [Paenibacillus agilis]
MFIAPKLDEHSKNPFYLQLYEFFKQEILSGNLSPHTRMPSLRKLAEQLNLSTTPVELAFQQLVAEGFIKSRPKSGYYVQALHPIYHKNVATSHQQASHRITARDPRYYRYDFHISKNDFSTFPHRIWRGLLQDALDHTDGLQYGDPQGEPALRHSITTYLRRYRGLRCTPDQVIIGADQYILASLLSLLLKHSGGSNRLGIEDPGYHSIPATFKNHGYKVVPIPLQESGIQIEPLYSSNINVVYTSPSHQFPTGVMMPIAKRVQLLEWANHSQGFIIEDDYGGEFRYHGRSIPSIQGLIENSPVVYLGSFSQAIAPTFCIHYMILPNSLLPAYHQLKWELYLEHSASRINQIALHHFMERGYFEKHLRRMRQLYKRKHDTLTRSIKQHFQDRAIVTGNDAGFHMILTVQDQRSEEELVELAKAADIRMTPMSFTWWKPPQHKKLHFIVGFGGIAEELIDEGIQRLKEVWFP